jgi:Peptidase family M48
LPSRSDIERPRGDPRRLFRLQLSLGAVGLLAAAAAVGVAASSVRQAPNGGGQLVIAGLRFTYPTLNIAAAILLALAALGSIVLKIALRSSWRQRRSYRSFLRQVDVLGSLNGTPSVTVIEGSTPQAFCAGYLRPAVYVSRGTVELLSNEELHAVLAHEQHHLRARDPLRFAVARILSQALFFLPVLRTLGNRYGELAEMTADDAAVSSSRGQSGPLASALLAFEGSGPPHAAGISNDRVDSLLGRPPRWRPLSAPVAMSFLVLSTFAMLMWRASEVASASATFNLPILSARPCLAFLTLILLFAFTRVLGRRRGVVGWSPRASFAG